MMGSDTIPEKLYNIFLFTVGIVLSIIKLNNPVLKQCLVVFCVISILVETFGIVKRIRQKKKKS